MNEQQQKLVAKFNVVIARLDHFEALKQELAALADRHVGYGVTVKQYDYVGAALLWTLEKALGIDWKPDVANAWKTFKPWKIFTTMQTPHPLRRKGRFAFLSNWAPMVRACLKFYPPENQCLMNLASQKSSYLSR
jgi:hypothetical protein